MTDLVDRVRRRLVIEGELAPAGSSHPGGAGLGDQRLDQLLTDESGELADDVTLAARRRDVSAELVGAGPLEPLLALPGLTDVLVNAPDEVWLDRGRGLERIGVGFTDDAAVRRLAQRLATAAGRRLDDASPFVDAVLPDGTRLHAVLPPLTRCTTISLRVLGRVGRSLDELVVAGSMPAPVVELLRTIVRARLAFAICGGTGTGKTTLLGAMLGSVLPGERVVVIEDAPELAIDHDHVVRLVPRPANVEGAGIVELRELVRQALRMRPDRLVVGEFRGAEMVELLVALNTGHEGGAATVHANSLSDVPARLLALGTLGGLGAIAVNSLVASALQVIVSLRRDGGCRRVAEIGVLTVGSGGPGAGAGSAVESVWTAGGLGPVGQLGPGADRLAALFSARGQPVPALLATPRSAFT